MNAESCRTHRRVLSYPLFGLSLGMLIAASPPAHAGAPVLPTGGKVVAGSASIGPPSGGSLTISQSSSKAILTWNGFSIGAGGRVQFDNGSGATLNRVTEASLSSIDGLLSGTGSVYLINPNGVIVGKSGVVKVGGTFVASTLDLSNVNFLAGGELSFTGSSPATVINYGKVGALGGDVALIAARVGNAGAITASNGTAALVGGYSVSMRDAALDDGRFSVLLGGTSTRVTNGGLIAAANAELRAEGGNVYALAGDTAGVIRATGVKRGDGHIWLVADGGSLDLDGATLDARGPVGAPGAIETSGRTVTIGHADIDAHSGAWTLDPTDLTVDAAAASTIDTALNGGTSVTQSTGAGGSGGEGDLTVAAPISWSTSASLTLSAYRNLDVNATIDLTGSGTLNLIADNANRGVGALAVHAPITVIDTSGPAGTVNLSAPTVAVTDAGGNAAAYVLNLDFGFGAGKIDYGSVPNGGAVTITTGGSTTNYKLLYSLADLQAIGTLVPGQIVVSDYALATDLVGTGTATNPQFSGPLVANFANGTLEGLGHALSNLTIGGFGSYGGVFGQSNSTLRDLELANESVSTGGGSIGGLVGVGSGVVVNVSSSGAIEGASDNAGGLVGVQSGGAIVNAYSATIVSSTQAGGLVGFNNEDALINTHATGAVFGEYAGGLVGQNEGAISFSYASGNVGGGQSQTGYAGGLVGENQGPLGYVYATGSVGGVNAAGGLVGEENGSIGPISHAYATGAVSGTSTGGLAGQVFGGTTTAPVTFSYWDIQTTGQGSDPTQTTPAGDPTTGSLGLTTAQFMNASSPIAGLGLGATLGVPGFVIVDADGTLNGANGATRPMLLSEYSTVVASAHQLQLIALDPGTDYILAQDIALGDTDPGEVWSSAGFVPIGLNAPFSGKLAGRGHTISNLFIDLPTQEFTGLFAYVTGTGAIRDLTLTGVNVTGANHTGGLAGFSQGLVDDVSVSGNVTGQIFVGGLLGSNEAQGQVTGSLASGAVFGPEIVGGLVGINLGSITGSSTSEAAEARIDDVGGLVGLNIGSVSDTSTMGSSYGGSEVGGLIGANYGSVVNANVAEDYTAYDSYTVYGSDHVGGLIGSNNGVVDYGLSRAFVYGANFVGGLVGSNEAAGQITNSTAIGGSITSTSYAGGLAGYNAGVIQNSNDDVYVRATGDNVGGLVGINLGLVGYAFAHDDMIVSQGSNVGGLVGLNAGTINYSYSEANALAGNDHVGGLVGRNQGDLDSVQANMTPGAFITGYDFVGGVAGSNEAGGVITNASSTGGAGSMNSAYVGGLVGINLGTIMYGAAVMNLAGASTVGGLIGYQGSTGTVTQAVADTTFYYNTGPSFGGLIGVNAGQVSAGYWTAPSVPAVNQEFGMNTGSPSDPNSKIANLGLASSYPGFDFANHWIIPPYIHFFENQLPAELIDKPPSYLGDYAY